MHEVQSTPLQADVRAVAQVLAGSGSYDSLGGPEQALVREVWAKRVTALRESLDFAAEFAASGESYAESDECGNVVIHPARG